MKFNGLVIEGELGSGAGGDVYLVYDSTSNKRYAMKNMEYGEFLDDYLLGEIKFNETVVKKYPNFFIQLKGYEITDCSLYKKKYMNKPLRCIRKVYTLVDGVVESIFDDLDIDAKVSISIQFMYILYVMLKEKMFQGDLNPGNIGYVKTNKKYVNLKVKRKIYRLYTYGYLVQLLDTDVIIDISGNNLAPPVSMDELINYEYCQIYLQTLGLTTDYLSNNYIGKLLENILGNI